MGCELHPNGPCRHDGYLLKGGGCFADPPRFEKDNPAFSPNVKPISLDSIRSKSFDRIDQVALVTFHFNPLGYRRLRETYYEWLPTLGPLPESLRCYELVFDDDKPEIDGSIVIRGTREKHWLWQKEAIVNRALRDTSPDVKYFGWLDHDMVIDDPEWIANSVALIDGGSPAVQLVGELHYLDRKFIPSAPRTSGMKNLVTKGSKKGNPGGAWIADRQFMDDIGGLNTTNIVGGGDQCFYDGFAGKLGWHASQYSEPMKRDLDQYVAKMIDKLSGRQGGYLSADVYHIWHGDRPNRQYETRNRHLADHGYDPAVDTQLNDDGILEWCSDKPAMHAAVRDYFAGRKEDG